MRRSIAWPVAVAALWVATAGLANGGPFVVVYPNGDPSARADPARVETDLMPHRETRLRVQREHLAITFRREPVETSDRRPHAEVTAAYTIENPTSQDITVDFGFPILRGREDGGGIRSTKVTMDGKQMPRQLVPLELIYGVIRHRAHRVIDQAIARDPTLRSLAKAIRQGEGTAPARLIAHLRKQGWSEHDAALMAAFPVVEAARDHPIPPLTWPISYQLIAANLGPLAGPIGALKATQFYAQLAGRLDPKGTQAFESIFAAWGGDVRERAVDLRTGKVRPRELSARREKGAPAADLNTVYARLDYLRADSSLTPGQKAACESILKHLPVVFTFAPMDLLHYRVRFPAKSTQVVTVSYSQSAYTDTGSPKSYQLAYVLHPATLWKSFGPIDLEVAAPAGVPVRVSVPIRAAGSQMLPRKPLYGAKQEPFDLYRAALGNKSGELYVAVDGGRWDDGPGKER